MKAGKAIGAGEMIVDIVSKDNKIIASNPGGSVFNTMVSIARQGHTALFAGRLTDDSLGRQILQFMHDNRMSIDFVQVADTGSTPYSQATLDAFNNANYRFFRNPPEKIQPLILPEISENDVVAIGSYFAVSPETRTDVQRLLKEAKKHCATIYYDINFRKSHAEERDELMPAFIDNFRKSDIVRCSREDLDTLFPNISLSDIYSRFLDGKLFIVTDAENLIYIRQNKTEKTYGVARIEPVSTIGAGDSFNAGLICSILNNENLLPKPYSETIIDAMIDSGRKFAAQACLSWENYVGHIH